MSTMLIRKVVNTMAIPVLGGPGVSGYAAEAMITSYGSEVAFSSPHPNFLKFCSSWKFKMYNAQNVSW